MNYWLWGDRSSKRQVRCKVLHMGHEQWGSIPALPASSGREAPDHEVCTWAAPPLLSPPVASWRVGCRPGRGPTKGWGWGRAAAASPRKSERPRCQPGHTVGERRGRGQRRALSSRPTQGSQARAAPLGPGSVRPPARPAVGNSARDGAARSPGPHPP